MNKRWIAYKLKVKDIAEGRYTDDGFIECDGLQVNRVRLMGTVVQKFVADDSKYGFFIVDDGSQTIRIRSFQDSVGLIKGVEISDIVDVFGRIRKYEDEIYVIPEIVKKVDDPNFWILRQIELKKQEEKTSQRKEEPKQEVQGPQKAFLEPKPIRSSSGRSVMPTKVLRQEPELRTAEPKAETIEVVEEEVIEEVIDKQPVKSAAKTEETISPRRKLIECIAAHDKGEGVDIDKLIEKCGLAENVIDNILTDLMNEGEIFEPRAGKVKILA
jgi:RPA family protein/predicted transcriptional regulator